MTEKLSIDIFAGFDAHYYSFYILGMMRLFTKERLSYTQRNCSFLSPSYFAFVTPQNRRIFIDALDNSSINIDGASWCSVYGKVNYSLEEIPDEFIPKILPIGPSFGIRLWSEIDAVFLALTNFLICHEQIKNMHNHFANYWRQYRYRLPESQYIYDSPQNNYIFSFFNFIFINQF